MKTRIYAAPAVKGFEGLMSRHVIQPYISRPSASYTSMHILPLQIRVIVPANTRRSVNVVLTLGQRRSG